MLWPRLRAIELEPHAEQDDTGVRRWLHWWLDKHQEVPLLRRQDLRSLLRSTCHATDVRCTMRTSYLPVICISLSLLIASKTTRALVLDRAAQPLITPAPVARHILEKRDALTWAYVLGSSSMSDCSRLLPTTLLIYEKRLTADMSVRLHDE